MKKLIILSAFCSALMVGCGGSSNVNVNTTRANNTAGNAANSAGSTMSNAANAVANAATSMTTAAPDAFMKDAAQGGMAEVELGKLASTNAQNPEVKKFGQMMVTEHTKANEELKALAAKKNVALPADSGTYKSDVDAMAKLKGADFDKEYVEAMVDDHEETVAMFEEQANKSADPDVKAFAAKTLPNLKKHLDMIKAIQAKLNQ